MNKYYLLFGLLIFISFELEAQSKIDTDIILFRKLFLDTNFIITKSLKSTNFNIRNNFSVKKLPIFCKIEHNMSLKARIPVKLRLGSVDYVDKLEGKN
jgi:hypothetical protein